MKRRCQNPKTRNYHNYGGRGIAVCERWQLFENFYEDMGDPPKGMTLERVDNDKGYSPENCVWADHETQMRNTRKTRNITINGETKCVAEWAEKLGVNPNTIYGRLYAGWPESKALGFAD